jgi:nitric oxide reductase NorD protein
MLDFLELEETVCRAWHRLVGHAASYPSYPAHAALLGECRGELGVMFRALGGEVTVQLVASGARVSGHRLGWRQRIGLGEERLDHPGRDAATLFLPERIALFDYVRLNRALYRWLAAWFAVVPVTSIGEIDPLRRDVIALRRAQQTTHAVLIEFPGLAGLHRELCTAVAAARPQRSLPVVEREVEAVVRGLLEPDRAPTGLLWGAVGAAGECRPKRRWAISRSCPARCGAMPGVAMTLRRATTRKRRLRPPPPHPRNHVAVLRNESRATSTTNAIPWR